MYRGLGLAGFHELSATLWGRRTRRRPLLCLHGYSGNSRDFDDLARELCSDRLVVCPDVAGRGNSAWLPPAGYHFGQFMADLRVLLARLDVDEVDVVGTSMGGLLGMLLAAQSGSPVKSLVMNDVGAYLPPDALAAIARNLEAPEAFASLEEVEAHMRRTHAQWGALADAQWRHLAAHGSRRNRDGTYRLHYDPAITRIVHPLPLTPGLYFWDAWYRVNARVLVLRGETSAILPRYVADTMLLVKPHARVVEIAGVGHVPSLMTGEQIALVRGFLSASAQSAERRGMGAVSIGSQNGPRQRIHPPRAA